MEGKYTSRGARLIEVNCRMGGGPVRNTNLLVWGVDLVEEQLLCTAGIPSRPPIAPQPLMNIAEFSINAQKTGFMKNTDWLDVSGQHGGSLQQRGWVFVARVCKCCRHACPGMQAVAKAPRRRLAICMHVRSFQPPQPCHWQCNLRTITPRSHGCCAIAWQTRCRRQHILFKPHSPPVCSNLPPLQHWRSHPDVIYANVLVKRGQKVVCVEDGLPSWVAEMMVTCTSIERAIELVKEMEADAQERMTIVATKAEAETD